MQHLKKHPELAIVIFFIIAACIALPYYASQPPPPKPLVDNTDYKKLLEQSEKTMAETKKEVEYSRKALECARMHGDNVARAQCYRNQEKVSNNDYSRQIESAEGRGWDVNTSTNPMDDSKTVTITLWSQKEKGFLAELHIRCKSKKIEAYIDWGTYLGLDETSVTTRIGKEQAVKRTWSLSTNNQATLEVAPKFRTVC